MIKKAPNTIDIDIQSRLNALKKNLISFNSSNNNNNNTTNNNNINFLPPGPPPSPPPSGPRQGNFFFQLSFPLQQTTPKQNYFWPVPRIPREPSTPLLPPDDCFLTNTKFGENGREKPEKVNENTDNALIFSLLWHEAKYHDCNSLSIHIESRNVFYDNFNTNENLFNFLLVQQDETK